MQGLPLGVIVDPDFTLPAGARCYVQDEGYIRVQLERGKWHARLHRLVWEQLVGSIPTGYVIHHANGDLLNNRLDNLQMMTAAEHSRLHRLHPELGSPTIAEYYAAHAERLRQKRNKLNIKKRGVAHD